MNRRHGKEATWVGWVGDMSTSYNYFNTKPWASFWCVPKTINSILRALGNVAFANNAITGLCILIGMFLGSPAVALISIVSGLIGVITSLFLNQPEELIGSGVSVFNTILVGAISVAVFPGLTGAPIDVTFLGLVLVACVFCGFIDKGLNAIMAPSTLPALSVPFNVTAAMFYIFLRSHYQIQTPVIPDQASLKPAMWSNETTNDLEINWFKVLEGTLLASGQVFGVGTVDASILIYIGYFFFSPTVCFFFYTGSVIGTLVGLLAGAPIDEVYAGLWGFNSMLTAGGLSFFIVPMPKLWVTAHLGALMAAVLQAAITPIYSPTTLPVFSYPFNVITLLIKAISTTPNSPLIRVTKLTFPEKHLILHLRNRSVGDSSSDDIEEQSPMNGKY